MKIESPLTAAVGAGVESALGRRGPSPDKGDEKPSAPLGPLGSLLETLERPVEVAIERPTSPRSGYDSSIWPSARPKRADHPGLALRLIGVGSILHVVGFCGFALAVSGLVLVLAGILGPSLTTLVRFLATVSLLTLALGPAVVMVSSWSPGRVLAAGSVVLFLTSGVAMLQAAALDRPLNLIAGVAAAMLILLGATSWALLCRRLAVHTDADTGWPSRLVWAVKMSLPAHLVAAPLILLLPSSAAGVLGMLVLLADGFLLAAYLHVTATLGWHCLRR